MKTYLLSLLLFFFFFINSASSFSDNLLFGSGQSLLVITKQNNSFSFPIPDEYILPNGELSISSELFIEKDNQIIYSIKKQNMVFDLSNVILPAKEYKIIMRLGNYVFVKKIP